MPVMRDQQLSSPALPRRHVGFASWQPQLLSLGLSPAMRDWISHQGSLTARLVAHSRQFRVQKLWQHKALCLADECEAIGLQRPQKVWEREVILRCDGEPMIYAHTVVDPLASAADWPLFRGLGERSLGSTLFSDPLVWRDRFHYASLHGQHPLMRRLHALLPAAAGWQRLPARRSVFRRRHACMLVTEVFLPGVALLQPADRQQMA